MDAQMGLNRQWVYYLCESFTLSSEFPAHHYVMCNKLGWYDLDNGRLFHWLIIIWKCSANQTPAY